MMKYSVVAAVAAFVGVANAQSQCLASVTGIPACALGYVAEIANSQFNCDIVDFHCQCSNSAGLLGPLQSSLAPYGDSCNFGSALVAANSFCGCTNNPGTVTLNSIQKQCEPSAVAIPGCALGYLASAGVSVGCAINDFACQCTSFDSISAAISDPVSSACGVVSTDISVVLASASALCNCVTGGAGPTGSPTDTPTTTTGGTGSPTGVTSPSSGGPTVPTTKPTTSGPGTSPTGSKNGTTPSVSNKPTTSAKGPSGSMSLSHFTGAGATASAVGGLFAMVAGVVALL